MASEAEQRLSRRAEKHRDPICRSPLLSEARNPVKRFFNEAKPFRHVAIHYDKRAENDPAALQLVSVRTRPRDSGSTS